MDNEETEEKSEPQSSLPSASDFYLKVPLYTGYHFKESDAGRILRLEYHQGTIDAYCVGCGRHSVFKGNNTASNGLFQTKQYAMSDKSFSVYFSCTRNSEPRGEHTLSFFFKVRNCEIMKIGQWPSVADLESHDIEKYRKLLGKDRHFEFKRSVGLASHGVGIGAFVYLRRIFESLIEEAYQKAPTLTEDNKQQFFASRMDEKILLLKDNLPAFLVENRRLYSILSKGIHSLSENECLKYFDTIRVGIELILDQKIEQQERQDKEAKTRRMIDAIKTELA